jgi:hypothetical protein
VLTRGSVEIWFHWEGADDAFPWNFCPDKPSFWCHHSQNYFTLFSLKGKSGQIWKHEITCKKFTQSHPWLATTPRACWCPDLAFCVQW